MAIIFPPSPHDDDKYVVGGIVYEYSDGAWRLSSDNAKAAIHVGTEPPANPQQGDLWFHSGEADLKIYYIDSTSEQWIPASSPPDPYEENFVSISGDTMTGMLKFSEINDGNGLRFLKDDGSTLSSLYRSSDGLTRANLLYGSKFALYCKSEDNSGTATMLTAQWKAGESEAKLYLYHVADPTNDVHAANKKYVDEAISAQVDTDRPKGMPGTPFKYSNRSGDSLDDGCFYIEDNGAMQISRISADGIEVSSYQTDDYSSNVRFACHVRGADSRVLHSMVSSHWYQGKGTNKRIEHSVSTRIRDGKGEMVVGTTYWITDGIFNF
jgi:hypothetical protein